MLQKECLQKKKSRPQPDRAEAVRELRAEGDLCRAGLAEYMSVSEAEHHYIVTIKLI